MLVGHALGAAKVLRYAATADDQRILAVVSCSGPRLSESAFRTSAPTAFAAARDKAESLVEQGKGHDLFDPDFPIPGSGMLSSAEAFLEKYCSEDFNALTLAPAITASVLMIRGDQENPRFADFDAEVVEAATQNAHRSAQTIHGADSWYVGIENLVPESILAWIESWSSESARGA